MTIEGKTRTYLYLQMLGIRILALKYQFILDIKLKLTIKNLRFFFCIISPLEHLPS